MSDREVLLRAADILRRLGETGTAERVTSLATVKHRVTLSPEALTIVDQAAHADPLPQPRPWHRDK